MYFLKNFIIFSIFFANFSFAQNIEDTIEFKIKNLEIEKLESEKKSNFGSFLPELNLMTGYGSTKEAPDEKTDGSFIYLESKLNLFNGFRDIKSRNIINYKLEKETFNKEFLAKNQKIEIYALILERNNLLNNKELLKAELEQIITFESMAKRKVTAGITSNAELFDFEIKESELNNEVLMNELKLNEIELKLKNLLNSESISFSEIIKNFPKLEDLKEGSFNLNNSPNLNALSLNQKISDLEAQIARNEHLPKLDLEVKKGQINIHNGFYKNKDEHEILLTLTIPLFNGGKTNAASTQSLIERNLEDLRTKKEIQEIESAFENQKNKLKVLNSLIKSSELNLKKAISFQSQILSEYKRGIKDSSDLIESAERTFELKTKLNELITEKTVSLYYLNLMFLK